MELKKMSETLNVEDFKFRKLDYLYHHHKQGNPLSNDFNFENYFYVTEVTENSVKVENVLSFHTDKGTSKIEISFEEWDDYWWFTRIPDKFI